MYSSFEHLAVSGAHSSKQPFSGQEIKLSWFYRHFVRVLLFLTQKNETLKKSLLVDEASN